MHRRDEDTYKQHLSAFKKTFPDFIYQSPNSLEPSSSIQEVEEVDRNGIIKEKETKEPQNLRGGGQDIPIVTIKK